MEAGLLIKLFLTFAKIGLVGFGGGMAILPLIYQSVSEFNAIDADEFADLFAISQATPGPLAVNAATFSGFETAGIPGAIAATLGVAFPAFILVALCVRFLNRYKQSRLVQGAFVGIRPVAVGMIMAGFVMMDAQGGLLAYRKTERETFANFLFTHTRLEKGSPDKDKYGYLERENRAYHLKLNVKVGFVKR